MEELPAFAQRPEEADDMLANSLDRWVVPGGAIPLHQAGAVEVNTVEHKKAHVGVLKGRFLEGQEVGAPDQRRVE